MKYNRDDKLIILDPTLRKTAPKGRDQLTIIDFNSIYGTYKIKYRDGYLDTISEFMLMKHWGIPPLWGTMSNG